MFDDPVLKRAFLEVNSSGKKVPNQYSEAIMKAFLHGASDSVELQRCRAVHKLRGFTTSSCTRCSGTAASSPAVSDIGAGTGEDDAEIAASAPAPSVSRGAGAAFSTIIQRMVCIV